MTVGSIVSLNRNEQDQSKINHAIQQLLQRNGGQQVNGSVTVSTNYSATVADFNINVLGSFEVTLPLVSAAPGQMYCVKNTSSGTTVTISPSTSGQTIDGSTSATLNVKNQTIWLQSNGTTWDVLNKNQDLSGYLQAANKLTEISTSLASTTITNLGFGTAATKNVGTSASNVVQLSTSAKLPAVDGSALTNLTIPTQSGTLVAGTQLVMNPYAINTNVVTQAHGLGTTPFNVIYKLVCLSSEQDYAVNEEVVVVSSWGQVTVSSDATNLYMTTAASLPQIENKTTHANVNITPANWKAVVTPYKLT